MRVEAGPAAGRASASSPAVRSRSTSLSSSTGPIHDLRAGSALLASIYARPALSRRAHVVTVTWSRAP
jgi:hypothetical protein